jgi:rhamnose transport system substrate-binding protein
MQPPASPPGEAAPPRGKPAQELILAVLLAAEVAVFAVAGKNFLSLDNAFEVARLSVEIGLLAVALTPVIVAGGIDLSVGSLMGLSAVLFGMLWRDAHVPLALAALLVLLAGAAAGGLNALLVTRLRLPPLIVTLGTFSLFRGLAEGMTGAVENYTGFPGRFLFLGQGYLFGVVPAQLPIFAAVAAGFWVLLHRTTVGRGLYAIGLSPEGARHAGIPVERRLALVYVLSGAVSSLAAIIYVSHLGQAKADAGTGYELLAITAVVLGGTSIFGGRGTVHGTLLGLFAIAVLKQGLRLADRPTELAGVLTGALLLGAIILERVLDVRKMRPATRGVVRPQPEGEFVVKNSQVAVLSAVILAGAALVAGSNWLLLRGPRAEQPAARSRVVVGMMPKSIGNPYFVACRQGAEEAAKELDVELLWNGPEGVDPGKQNEVVEGWITRGVDVIAVAAENGRALSSVLRKAQGKGIKVVTWDSDAEPDARDFFVNQATPQGIGETLMDHAARVLKQQGDPDGEFAIITASLTAANMIEWQKYIEQRRREKYPHIKEPLVLPCDDQQDKAFAQAKTVLNSRPKVKLIMAICSPAVPGAAAAVKEARRDDVKVIGLGLPSDNKPYVHAGITDCVILWNTMDLGYLTVQAAYGLKTGTLRPGDRWMQAGRLRNVEISGDNILLGKPLTFTKDNIDRFDF